MDIDKLALCERIRKKITSNEFSTPGPGFGVDLPKEYIDKMMELGEKYQKVKWLPLDIPKITFDDLDEFKDLWQEESIGIVRTKPDVAEPYTKETHPFKEKSSYHVAQFNGLTLWQNPHIPIDSGTFLAKKYEGDNKQIKRIVEQVFEFFPIHTMQTIFIWQSTMEIIPHRDQTAFWKCPTEFRVMLHDENTDPTLYTYDMRDGDLTYIDLPDDTNSFCWSNGTQLHGSDYHGKTKYLLCICGFQHSKKSDDLFERSIAKYKNKLNYRLDYDI